MSGCFGLVGVDRDGPVVAGVRGKLGEHTAVPMPRGTLLMMPSAEFLAELDLFCDTIRANPTLRYVLTVGDFNDGDLPFYYDLYCDFGARALEGEVLLCPEVCARLDGEVRVLASVDYHPMVSGVLPGMNTIETPFGTLDSWALWYSGRSSYVLDRSPRFEGMTGPGEVHGYWLTDQGFTYLATQATTIRANRTPSRRIVLYTAVDTRSELFLRLMSAFEAVGVELVFVFEDDARDFATANGLADVDLYGRSGDHSFVSQGVREYVSDDPAVALAISQMQEQLMAAKHPARGLAELLDRQYPDIDRAARAAIEQAGATARDLLAEFTAHPERERAVLLPSYAERWRALCAA